MSLTATLPCRSFEIGEHRPSSQSIAMPQICRSRPSPWGRTGSIAVRPHADDSLVDQTAMNRSFRKGLQTDSHSDPSQVQRLGDTAFKARNGFVGSPAAASLVPCRRIGRIAPGRSPIPDARRASMHMQFSETTGVCTPASCPSDAPTRPHDP